MKKIIDRLISIIIKNMLRIKNSHASLIIILFGPLLLVTLIGAAFNTTQLSGITIGVYSTNYSVQTNKLIDNINTKQFNVFKTESKESCKEGVKSGKEHLCLIFEGETNNKDNIMMYVDYSRMNLVWTLLEVMNEKFTRESVNLGKELSKQILNSLDDTTNTLQNKKILVSNLKNKLDSFRNELIVINKSLNDFNIVVPNQNFNDALTITDNTKQELDNTKSNIYDAINKYKKRIKKAENELDTTLSEVKKERKSEEKMSSQLAIAYNDMNCVEADDLSSYFEDGNIDDLNNLTNPECSFIFTMKKKIDGSINSLKSNENSIKNMESQLSDINNDLDNMKDQANELFDASDSQLEVNKKAFNQANNMLSTAKTQSNNLNQNKLIIKNRLVVINKEIIDSKNMITDFEGVIDSVISNIDSGTTITPENIVSPFNLRIKPVTSEHSNLDYLFPTLIVLVIMFISTILGVTLVNKEKNSKAYFRNFITPTNESLFILGIFITCLIITTIELLIIAGFGTMLFNINILTGGSALIITILLSLTIFTLIGILIGSLIDSEETTTLTAIITCIILFLFSSTIVPIESMSSISKLFVKFNPFYLLELLFRKQMIFGASLLAYPTQLIFLTIELILLIIGVWVSWIMIKQRL